jgi:alkylation response protein AidB-like acyl-CoA dehydrogenase
MDGEQLSAMRETARRFARREVAPLVGTEGRDGDLGRLEGVLARAGEAGILASADPEGAGFEYGVWGRASLDEGAASSVAVLEELAVECAGVAACVHFAGLGVLELAGEELAGEELAGEDPAGGDLHRGPVAVAILGRGWRVTWSGLETPPPGAVQLGAGGLMGTCNFVYGAPGTHQYVVYAAGDRGWERALVTVGAEGLNAASVEPRMGLSAARVEHLNLEAVEVVPRRRLAPATPGAHVRRLMLGLAALAVGNARGALREGRRYAEERFQGGAQIEDHSAVQLLLGDSATRVAAAAAWLREAATRDGEDSASLWRAFAAKLRCCVACGQAVTDSLQVLGGYGYMEEYRLEKRLRDAMTLEAMVVNPNTLRILCATDPGGVP